MLTAYKICNSLWWVVVGGQLFRANIKSYRGGNFSTNGYHLSSSIDDISIQRSCNNRLMQCCFPPYLTKQKRCRKWLFKSGEKLTTWTPTLQFLMFLDWTIWGLHYPSPSALEASMLTNTQLRYWHSILKYKWSLSSVHVCLITYHQYHHLV